MALYMMTKLRLLYDHEAGVQLANPYLRPVIIHAPDSIESLTLAEEAFDRGFTKTKLYQDGWRLAGKSSDLHADWKVFKKALGQH